jgi:hypothetical protein
MKPNPGQQALAAIAVLLVVAVTFAVGLFLALSDDPGIPAAVENPTPTAFRLATLDMTGNPDDTPTPTREVTAVPTVILLPSQTPTRTLIPTNRPPPTPSPRPASGGMRSTPRPPTQAATPLPTPGPTQTTSHTDGACTYADSLITAPEVGQILSGVVRINGSADYIDFKFYKIEMRQEGYSTREDYVTVITAFTPVQNWVLATVDTRAFANGEWWMRLVVTDSTGNYPERCAILVVIRN